MANHQQEGDAFGGRTVPPGTPPVLNANTSPSDAIHADPGGDTDFPGHNPDEVDPGKGGDIVEPDRSPEQEVPGGGGDTVQPGQTPAETPAQPNEPGIVPPD